MNDSGLRRTLCGLLCSVLLNLMSPSHAPAQFGEFGAGYMSGRATSPGISAIGTSVINRSANRMRVRATITVRGKDLDDAMVHLKEKRTWLAVQLNDLGALKDSVEISPCSALPGKSDKQWQIDVMQQRSRNEGRTIPESVLPPPVLITMRLTADWALSGRDDGLLLNALELQKKIKAVDLSGLKALAPRFPRDAGTVDDAQGSDLTSFDRDDSTQKGEPVFYFVADISEADHKQAAAEAFQKIKRRATQLAEAAGVQLGDLQSLAASQTGLDQLSYDDQELRHEVHEREREDRDGGNGGRREAIGNNPGLVTYRITVSASFGSKTIALPPPAPLQKQ